MSYIEDIAEEIKKRIPSGDLPKGDTTGLFHLYALLALTLGMHVSANDVHDAWAVWMLGQDKNHEALVPFGDLSPEVQEADQPYVDAIREVASSCAETENDGVDRLLFPNGVPTQLEEKTRLFDIYKLMVDSSESLVGRRQGVNTFFLTINGAIIAGLGLVVRIGGHAQLKVIAIAFVALMGLILALAWRSLIKSFGQLNAGKFVVIHRLEKLLPASIYAAEWEALGRGEDPKIYRSFTSREIWAPNALVVIYSLVLFISVLFLAHFLKT